MVDGRGPALERLIAAATDGRGRDLLPWIAAPLREARHVVDLACGSGPLADAVRPGAWIGVDRGAAGHRRTFLRADPVAAPIQTRSVDAVTLLFVLPLMPDLDALFAEVRRILRPGGTLVVTVPSQTVRTSADVRLARVLRPVRRGTWPHRSALDHAGWLLAAADFAVLGDDRVEFAVPLPDAAAALPVVVDLVTAGIWPPGMPVAEQERVAGELGRRAGPDRVLPVPVRRLVARR